MRITLLLYAGYALAAAFLLYPLGAVVTASAGAVSLLCALRGSRRPAIALHAVLVPAQFALSVPSDLPLAGLALSTAVLVAARPVFPRLRPPVRKLLLTLHVGLSVTWLGLATAMTALAVIGLVTADAGLRLSAYRIMHVFDLTLVIPVVMLAILTGLTLSLGTVWGLVRHWWVLIKFGSSLAIPMVAGVQHLWISALIARPDGDPTRLLLCFVAYDLTLWTAVALSVVKPGGRTPWAPRTGSAAPRPHRTPAPG